jgi:hypothetical protein
MKQPLAPISEPGFTDIARPPAKLLSLATGAAQAGNQTESEPPEAGNWP